MWNFQIGRTFGLMLKTMPFIALRTAVYLGSSLILILGGIGGPALGVLLMPTAMWQVGAWGGLTVGLGVASTIVYFIREYFLYLVKAGHIAVLVELMEGRSLPKGKGQLSYAKTIVAERFVEASSFFVLDQVITGILSVVNRALVGLGSFIPGMDGVMAFVGTVLRVSLTFADEVILALSFRTRSEDTWRTSRDGVVLYAQNYKNILKNAFFLALLNYALLGFFMVIVWTPALWLAGLMPGSGSAFIAFVMAVLLVYSIKKALVEPILMTALMQVYFKAIEGQVPNPEGTQKLTGMSEKFRNMTAKFSSAEPTANTPLIAMQPASDASTQQAGWGQPGHAATNAGYEQAPIAGHRQQPVDHGQPAAYSPQHVAGHGGDAQDQAGQQQAWRAQAAQDQVGQQQAWQAQQQAWQAQAAQQQAWQAQQAAQWQAQQAAQHQAWQAQQQYQQPAMAQGSVQPGHAAPASAAKPSIGATTLPMGTVRR